MKRAIALSIIVCVLAAACTRCPDDREFIRNMYEKSLYEDYSFLEKHCSKSLLEKLSEQYDYIGEGYAVWKFRSGAQDGPSDECALISVTAQEDGWYRYTAMDMGIQFTRRIRLSHKGGKCIIEDLAEADR